MINFIQQLEHVKSIISFLCSAVKYMLAKLIFAEVLQRFILKLTNLERPIVGYICEKI